MDRLQGVLSADEVRIRAILRRLSDLSKRSTGYFILELDTKTIRFAKTTIQNFPISAVDSKNISGCFAFVNPEDSNLVDTIIERVMSRAQESGRVEFCVRQKDAGPQWLQCNIYNVPKRKENPPYLLGVLEKISQATGSRGQSEGTTRTEVQSLGVWPPIQASRPDSVAAAAKRAAAGLEETGYENVCELAAGEKVISVQYQNGTSREAAESAFGLCGKVGQMFAEKPVEQLIACPETGRPSQEKTVGVGRDNLEEARELWRRLSWMHQYKKKVQHEKMDVKTAGLQKKHWIQQEEASQNQSKLILFKQKSNSLGNSSRDTVNALLASRSKLIAAPPKATQKCRMEQMQLLGSDEFFSAFDIGEKNPSGAAMNAVKHEESGDT